MLASSALHIFRGEAAFYNFLVEKSGHGYSLVINDPDIPRPVCEAGVSVALCSMSSVPHLCVNKMPS